MLQFFSLISDGLGGVIWDVDLKAQFFCGNYDWFMENMDMDKEVTVPKWVLIVRPKKTQMPNLSAQAQKFGILMKKGFIGRP